MFSRIKNIYREYTELKYLAYHDTLTGLLNRNWLYRNIEKIKTKYVYFIDLNNLKEINKNGHTIGDEYIKNTILNIKHNGILVRYAGDEFILFSNHENEITTNIKYSVGYALVGESMSKSINIADNNMIKSKLNFKKLNNEK